MLPVAGLAAAQSRDALEEDGGLIIPTESNLVVLPLHLYKDKTAIGGLGKVAFAPLENRVEKDIAFVEGPAGPDGAAANWRSVRVEIVFMLDVSHSVMRPGLLNMETIRASLQEGLSKNAQVSFDGFALKLTRLAGPTNNLARIRNAHELAYAAEDGQTRIFELIVEAADAARTRRK